MVSEFARSSLPRLVKWAFGHDSIGALGGSVEECESLELRVASAPSPFPEHVLVEFSGFDRKQIENRSKGLRGFALDRGWLYQA